MIPRRNPQPYMVYMLLQVQATAQHASDLHDICIYIHCISSTTKTQQKITSFMKIAYWTIFRPVTGSLDSFKLNVPACKRIVLKRLFRTLSYTTY